MRLRNSALRLQRSLDSVGVRFWGVRMRFSNSTVAKCRKAHAVAIAAALLLATPASSMAGTVALHCKATFTAGANVGEEQAFDWIFAIEPERNLVCAVSPDQISNISWQCEAGRQGTGSPPTELQITDQTPSRISLQAARVGRQTIIYQIDRNSLVYENWPANMSPSSSGYYRARGRCTVVQTDWQFPQAAF